MQVTFAFLYDYWLGNASGSLACPSAGGEDCPTETSRISRALIAPGRVQAHGERLHHDWNRRERFQSQDSLVEIVSDVEIAKELIRLAYDNAYKMVTARTLRRAP